MEQLKEKIEELYKSGELTQDGRFYLLDILYDNENEKKSFDRRVKSVIEEVDWERIQSVMDFLNWEWCYAEEGVPNITELKDAAMKLFEDLFKLAFIKAPEDTYTNLSSGGIEVSCCRDTENRDEYTLEFKFVLTENRSEDGVYLNEGVH